MSPEDITKRLEELTDRELILWRFTFERLVQLEMRLTNLEASFAPRHLPDAELATIQEHLRLELKNRTARKGPAGPDVL